MVEDGYAAVLTRYPLNAEFKTRLQQKQDSAKTASRGLWGKHPKTTNAWFGE
jgi:endonuclease YncB( thermonuclease family)